MSAVVCLREPGRDVELVPVMDSWGEVTGYRLRTTDQSHASRLYLSREAALDAWINRRIDWEDAC